MQTRLRQRGREAVLSGKRFRHFSGVELLVVLTLWLVTAPLVWGIKYGQQIETILATVVFFSAVLAVSRRRGTLVWATVLAMPAAVCRWANHLHPHMFPMILHVSLGMVFMGFVAFHLLRFILRAPTVNPEVLCAGVSGYLFLGIFWGLAYTLVGQLVPNSFSFAAPGRVMAGPEAIYFSFVTLCTVGYGDVVPTSPSSRMLAIMEAAAGTFYMTILIARLVSLYSSQHRTATVEAHADSQLDELTSAETET